MNRSVFYLLGGVLLIASVAFVAVFGWQWYQNRQADGGAPAASSNQFAVVRLRSAAENQNPAAELRVVVSSQDIQCEGRKVTPAQAPALLKRLLADTGKKDIAIDVVPGTPYARVVDLISRIRSLPAGSIWVTTEQTPAPKAP